MDGSLLLFYKQLILFMSKRGIMIFNTTEYGYRFKNNSDEIEFFLDAEFFPETTGYDSVYISGSFNGWQASADAAWKLEKKVEKKRKIFSLVKEFSKINVPGNSGFPEFNFILLAPEELVYLRNAEEGENGFCGNRVIVRSDEERDELLEIKRIACGKKSFSDFDLNCPSCRADLANLRFVPGTGCLLRGYHPYKKSFADSALENERIANVRKAFGLYGIKSVITLSGYELPSEFAGEDMPDFMTDIEKNENRVCLSLDYVLAYYHSDAAEFSNLLRKVSLFIINHPGPFYIHCRTGGDKTGVVCAVLAALSGASWEQIARDFEKTLFSALDEYRSRRLLQYSLQKIIGYSFTDSKNLARLMQSYFIKEKILSAEEIKKVLEKLCSSPRKKETDYFNFTENHICAKRSAKI